MKMLKQLFFVTVFVIGLSLTAMAQKQDDDKKRPPKNNPEIKAEDKNQPKNDNRNNDNRTPENRPKKPQAVIIKNGEQTTVSFN